MLDIARKDEEPSQSVKDWLGLALKEPNNPRVLRVRRVVGHLKDGRDSVAEKASFERHSAADSQPPESNVEVLQSTTPKSEPQFRKFSEKDRDAILDDLVEHLRVTKAFKLFADIKGSDRKPN